ncbi:cytochrome P450 [Amycolatopsis sp. NPDC059090]|uniref:cytochrome P450 n=1 Tax=Amycolatopsis sp. NPDC059090 TaxID=3346723 RepID=UPI003672B6EA
MAVPVQLPIKQPGPLLPSPALRRMQARDPIHRVRTAVGDEGWFVTGHEEVRRLLCDPRLGRAHPDPGNAARTGESVLFGRPLGNYDTEHADHARMRGLLQPHFAPKLMRALTPRVEALAKELLDQLARDQAPADLHQALALPLPILVICELLGVPYGDRERFRAWTQAAANVRDGALSMQGIGELYEYGRHLVARKRSQPAEDVISRLCATDGVPDDEIAKLSMVLLFSGYETTVVMIGMGALLLLAHPDQWQALAADDRLIAAAVEEILRTADKGGVGGIPRYAKADLRIGGVTVRMGELVVLSTGAANHDATVFPNPDEFDITRPVAAQLAFGHGGHYCIGAPLARIELHALFSQLVPAFPAMRLAVPVEELKVRTAVLTGGLIELPVTW